MRKPREDVLAIAFLILVVTLFFAAEVFTDRTLVTFRLTGVFPWISDATRTDLDQPSVTSDCTLSYYPRRVFATSMIRDGQIPFWNPHQFCGTPFLANFQSAVFYPVNLVLYGFDPATQMDLFLYVHFLIAAVFSYLLARKLKLSSGASVVSALSFSFCGFMVTRYGQPTFISTASWLPAVLYFAECLIESPSFRRAGILGLGISLCILAGFPQLVLAILYTLVFYVAVRLVLIKQRSVRWKSITALFVVVSLAVACLVCAFQILPTHELSTFSYRKGLPYQMVLSSAHHRLVSLKYLIPDILGDPVDVGVLSKALHKVEQEPRFAQNYVSTTGYVGILPLLLSVLALTAPDRRLVPFIALATVSVLVVFGTGVLWFFYRFIPGFSFSRVDRVILIYMCSIAIMAGYGFDAAQSGRVRKRLFYSGAGFLCFAACFVLWLHGSGLAIVAREAAGVVSKDVYMDYAWGKIVRFTIISALTGGLFVIMGSVRLPAKVFLAAATAFLLIDLVPNGLKLKVSQPADGIVPENQFVENLRSEEGLWRIAKYGADVIPANTATLLGIHDMHGYDALNVDHYIEVLGAIDTTMVAVGNAALRRRIGPISDPRGLDSRVMDLLNVKYVLSVGQVGSLRHQPVMMLNADYLPRAFLVGQSRFFDTHDEVLDYMKTPDFDPAAEVLLIGEGQETTYSPEPGAPGEVEIVTYGPCEITLTVNAERACYLVVSDVYYPGWDAYVDGCQSDLLRADYAFRAVEIAPGIHEVRMAYTPVHFRVGVLLSAAGIALLGALISSGRHWQVPPQGASRS